MALVITFAGKLRAPQSRTFATKQRLEHEATLNTTGLNNQRNASGALIKHFTTLKQLEKLQNIYKTWSIKLG